MKMHEYKPFSGLGEGVEWCAVCWDGSRGEIKHEDDPIHLVLTDEPIHEWFGLSYAQYLTIPRTVLQSMPLEWQRRFTACLSEIDGLFDWMPEGEYRVRLYDRNGKYKHDALADYERGRRRLAAKPDTSEQKG